MSVSEQQILGALRTVQDPEIFKDLVALNQVKGIKILEGSVAIEVATPSPHKDKLRQAIEAAVMKVEGVEEVFISFGAPTSSRPAATGAPHGGHSHGPAAASAPPAPRGIPGVKYIVAVGAGKGGVGKSTVAINLAVGLARAGKKVGLLDGDIYGPSIPTLTGIGPRPPQVIGERIIPFTISDPANAAISLSVMSIGFLVDKEKALIWRGPMAHGAIKQFLEEVDWTSEKEDGGNGGGLDYLIVDLPPGTGDVALTLAQTVPLTGAVIVATPQEVALADARRAVRMFQQLGVEILGVVENMSYFVCEHGTEYDIFGRGGAQLMAQQMGLPFLGGIPIDTRLRIASDEGTPFANFGGESVSRKPLEVVAEMLDKQVAVRMAMRPAAKKLNLEIS